MEHWVWLPEKKYPERQKTKYSCMGSQGEQNYTVAELERRYAFAGKRIKRVRFTVSGDTAFLLFEGGTQLLRGPAWVGGDFLYNDVPRPEYYATRFAYEPAAPAEELALRALVRMGSVRICEYSRGAGGFALDGTVEFEDGGTAEIQTDESWRIRLLGAYTAPCAFDNAVPPEPFVAAEPQASPCSTLPAPIPPCTEFTLPLTDGGAAVCAAPGEHTAEYTLGRICACYITVHVTGAPAEVRVTGYELPGGCDWEYGLRFAGSGVYYGMELQSVGGVRVTVKKQTAGETRVRLELRASHYPTPFTARTETSDPALNLVLNTCAHALKYCRQSIHLDSPRHCEPLACTGDYYIETLMTVFTYGDMRLAAFDVYRTANLLRQHDGEMFHTSYSLIWALMLWDVYLFTGDISVLRESADALELLLRRFAGYVGENGLLETPPNYMFVDWLSPDGIDLHHPPKALGQTCLCMFYFGALGAAEKVFRALGKRARAARCRAEREALRTAVLHLLWDGEKQLFCEGLNTPTPPELLAQYMPQNTAKRYFRKHANILAAYFGFFGKRECRALLKRIIFNDALGQVQPYFQHFLLEAVYRSGLRGQYTLKLLEQWKAPVLECPRGLPEGFYKPTPTYGFDRSHAWAGTPAYALPLAVSGLKILEPGFRRVKLSPSSLGLRYARVEIPTPYGPIEIEARQGEPPTVRVPEGIAVT